MDGEFGFLELKCSEEYGNIDPKYIYFISKNPPFLFSETNFKIFVNKSHTYYDQIQMQLALTRQSWCDFIFCTSFLVFSGSIIKDQWEKWINKISSLHLKVPQKVPGIFRSSHRRCSVKKGVPRNFAKFTGKHLCQSLFFNKVAGSACVTLKSGIKVIELTTQAKKRRLKINNGFGS